MNIVLLSKEYPPHVYGGAGVHVEYLFRELAKLENHRHGVKLVCFGEQQQAGDNSAVQGVDLPSGFSPNSANGSLVDTLMRDVLAVDAVDKADVIHCHTWYTHLAGCILKNLLHAPLVLTTHSLEPDRPWKREQLRNGYDVSSWLERTAFENADGVVAVSGSMKKRVEELYCVPSEKIRVIHNGIDPDEYRPVYDESVLRRYGIDPDVPFLLFVGRITRQKGIVHLVDAIRFLNPGMQIVLCAGAPDTDDIRREMEEKVTVAREATSNPVVWVRKMVPKDELVVLYSHAAVFVCPSVYEPFGIINLEAMACETPVVASGVGGIPEIVVDGRTGFLVPIETDESQSRPRDPEGFARALADGVNRVMESPELGKAMGKAGRERVERFFTWSSIAAQTAEYYRELAVEGRRGKC